MANLKGLLAIQGLDLEVIARRLRSNARGPGWTKERVEKAIKEYREYLTLQLREPGTEAHPSDDCDEVWHKHILDTTKYRQDCQAIFGHYLDHVPCDGPVNKEGEATCAGPGQGCGSNPSMRSRRLDHTLATAPIDRHLAESLRGGAC